MALSISHRHGISSDAARGEEQREEVQDELDLALAEAARDPEEEIDEQSESLSSESGITDELNE